MRRLRQKDNKPLVYQTPAKEERKDAFMTSESHFLKRVKKHPERDMEDFVRILDQSPRNSEVDRDESFQFCARRRLFSETQNDKDLKETMSVVAEPQ